MNTDSIRKALDRNGRWLLPLAWAVTLAIGIFLNAEGSALREQANIPGGILGYEITGTAERLQLYETRIQQAGLTARLVRQLWVDYVYIIAYVAALWGSARALGKLRLMPGKLSGPLSFAARFALFAGGLDMLENSCLLAARSMEAGTTLDIALVVAAVAAVIKFVLVGATLVVLAIGLGCVLWTVAKATVRKWLRRHA